MSASCTSPGSLASNPPVRRGAPGDDQAGDLSASASVLIEVVPLSHQHQHLHLHGRLHVDLRRTASMACTAAPSHA